MTEIRSTQLHIIMRTINICMICYVILTPSGLCLEPFYLGFGLVMAGLVNIPA